MSHEHDAPRDPIAAVTHPDPYPYYADLVTRRPVHRDHTLGLWIACSAAAVTAILTSEQCHVRPASEQVPRAIAGAPSGAIFGRLVRMNDGAAHGRVRPAVAALAARMAEAIDEPAHRWARHLAD